MDNKAHQEIVQKAVQRKFRGKQEITGRTKPRYPESAEREYKRITNGYMRILNRSLKEHLPAIVDAYKVERMNTDSRYDQNFSDMLRKMILQIAAEIEEQCADFGLDELIGKISKSTANNALREWKKTCSSTLGVDIFSDYYKGEFYGLTIQQWVNKNVSMIKSLPNLALDNMEEVIMNGFRNGMSITDLRKAIQDCYDVSKSKAQFLARDQLSTLNAEITQQQQRDAGVTKYKWSSSRDERVRECHAELDGQIFDWDDPPEMWYETKYGIVYTGRYCHPGEDYQCRCCAIPVFDWQTVDIPIQESVKPR